MICVLLLYSLGAERWKSWFVGKKYNKTDTLHVASLGCLHPPQIMPHVSHVRKLGSWTLFIMAHAPNDKKSTFSNIDMLYIIL